VQRKPKSQIKSLRKKEGLTQGELASLWGVSTVTVQNWETKLGQARHMVNFSLLCIVLEINTQDFISTLRNHNAIENLNKIRDRILKKGRSYLNCCLVRSSIINLRRSKNLTQADLAIVLDTSLHTVQNLESGRTSGNKFIQSIMLCQILACHHTELIDHIPEYRLIIARNLIEEKLSQHHRRPKIIEDIRNQIIRTRSENKN